MEGFAQAGISEMASALRSGETTASNLAKCAIDRVERLDRRLGAVVQTTKERAMAEAAAADEHLASDPNAPLVCGIPYAAKDLFDVAAEASGCGCPVLADNHADRDSAAVARLSASGMVLVAKTRMSPLAADGAGLNFSEGTPRNPWITEPHVAGGSSSGSAVAVAAGMVPVALGTDTGGSVRIPAALCGITGLKTTLGQISRAGVMPLSQNLDTVGVLGRSASDAAQVFEVLRGPDPADSSTVTVPPPEKKPPDLRRLRMVIAEGEPLNGADEEIVNAIGAAAETFRELGISIEYREMSIFSEILELEDHFRLLAGESWRNVGATLDAWGPERDGVTDWICLGAEVTDDQLEQARETQRLFQARFASEMAGIDALVMPTTRKTARPIAEVEADPASFGVAYWGNTTVGNFLNVCGLSLPCGFDWNGHPIGLQLCAPSWADDRILAVGAAWQAATPFQNRHPIL